MGPKDRIKDFNLAQPRGFHDRAGVDVELEDRAIRLFGRRAALIGCHPLKTAPLGFRAFFEHARGDFSDKTYQFEDKSGRQVMLCPDSTSAIIRWYSENKNYESERVFFRSPVFRYRRQTNRHFTQIGMAFFNEPSDAAGMRDDSTVLLARTAIRMFTDDFGISVYLKVTDLGVWHEALKEAGLDHPQRVSVLSRLRKVAAPHRLDAVKQILEGGAIPPILLRLVSLYDLEPGPAALGDEKLSGRAQHIGESVVAGMNCSFTLAFDDLHACEIQDSLAFSLIDTNGNRCVDGGSYSYYANQFDDKITSLHSFATSVEYLVRTAPVEMPHPNLLLIISLDGEDAGAGSIEESCQAVGIPVIRRPLVARLGDVIRKTRQARWLIVYGSEEAASGKVRLRDLQEHQECVLFSQAVAEYLQAATHERSVSCI